MEKTIIGFVIIYGIVITIIPQILYNYLSFTRFITYVANVDLIANILSTNFPDYFKLTYDNDSKSLIGYISFNLITLYALSGIFLYGLQLKLIGHNDIVSFRSMIAVSVITFTLPTLLIPYLTKHFTKLTNYIALNHIKGDHKTKDEKTNEHILTKKTIKLISVIVSTFIALFFILLEGYFIENYLQIHKYDAKGKRVFGKKHNNPLESFFKDNKFF